MTDELLDEAPPTDRIRPGGRRDRLRRHPATRHPYRIAVFVLGLTCVAIGIALVALPGPLTIPPILLGVWIWSWEFRWADRLLDRAKASADEAWAAAKARPTTSALVTIAGLVAAGVAIYVGTSTDVVDDARAALGL